MAESRVWFFPDGDLPPAGDVEPKGHESLLILNAGTDDAEIVLTIYFETEPSLVVPVGAVLAERIRCLRLDGPLGDGGYRLPFGQYALKVDATIPVICQIGRMDVRQPNLAYYTVLGHPG